MESLGKVAYEAYCERTGGRSAVTGERLPEWEQVQPVVQDAWDAAGRAVASTVLESI